VLDVHYHRQTNGAQTGQGVPKGGGIATLLQLSTKMAIVDRVCYPFAMVFALIFVGFSSILSPLCAFLVFRRYLEQKQSEIEQRLEAGVRDWITPPEEGKLSKLGIAMDAIGTVVGSAAARSLQAQIAQTNSAVANVANGLSAEANAARNPLAMLASGGKRGKGAALARLVELIGPMLGGTGAGSGGNNGGKTPFIL
jgi:hypothetical protein